jgi:hypothetical protein
MNFFYIFAYNKSMQTKLQTLKDAANSGDWQKAIAIAAKFPRLGSYKNAILDAHVAYTNPRWAIQFGKDLETYKNQGIKALKKAFLD